ncbi:hypothetical protein Scep_028917 [Stephania cephalantha]|uniref:Uncharacterized protein n=1 Tax=Stephania cephalantha TaxID=152367 RepID=A0AAP0HNV7_9MAGN
MNLGSLRTIICPLVRAAITQRTTTSPARIFGAYVSSACKSSSTFGSLPHHNQRWMYGWNEFHSLTDTRLPKRRPGAKPRRKRASLKPPGPYAWVQYTPGEPILANRPNEGSVKGRKEKKRRRQRRAFIRLEAKKRKAQFQEANRKKNVQRIERKMAAVARDRAWAERLAELQKLEAEKSTAA